VGVPGTHCAVGISIHSSIDSISQKLLASFCVINSLGQGNLHNMYAFILAAAPMLALSVALPKTTHSWRQVSRHPELAFVALKIGACMFGCMGVTVGGEVPADRLMNVIHLTKSCCTKIHVNVSVLTITCNTYPHYQRLCGCWAI
jgi:hypothetical protein